jgi:hypothetical protein
MQNDARRKRRDGGQPTPDALSYYVCEWCGASTLTAITATERFALGGKAGTLLGGRLYCSDACALYAAADALGKIYVTSLWMRRCSAIGVALPLPPPVARGSGIGAVVAPVTVCNAPTPSTSEMCPKQQRVVSDGSMDM